MWLRKKRDHATQLMSCREGEQSRKMHVRWRYGQSIRAERKVVKEEPKGRKAGLIKLHRHGELFVSALHFLGK